MSRSLFIPDPRARKRARKDRNFRRMGRAAVVIALSMLAVLMVSILTQGLSGFQQTRITMTVSLPAEVLDKKGNRDPAEMAKVTTLGYDKIMRTAMADLLADQAITIEGLSAKDAAGILSKDAAVQLRDAVLENPDLIDQRVEFDMLVNGRIDGIFKGRVNAASAERDANITPQQVELSRILADRGLLRTGFNLDFITGPDASDQRPEAAGLGIAIRGSLMMMIVVLVLALPLGVGASIYLEEFARPSVFSDLIEVTISNLAAVPSIVFGILGLAVFINTVHLPQSAPLVGGLVLTLMTLPTVIITTRAALKAVPPSIRDAALGLGASRMQGVLHHVLPLAGPGILTGTILGLAQALGETAPLLLIGMVAFVNNMPAFYSETNGLMGDPATALPVQIFNWTQRADPAFVERAFAAILVLLAFLAVMNITAIWLRRRFEKTW